MSDIAGGARENNIRPEEEKEKVERWSCCGLSRNGLFVLLAMVLLSAVAVAIGVGLHVVAAQGGSRGGGHGHKRTPPEHLRTDLLLSEYVRPL